MAQVRDAAAQNGRFGVPVMLAEPEPVPPRLTSVRVMRPAVLVLVAVVTSGCGDSLPPVDGDESPTSDSRPTKAAQPEATNESNPSSLVDPGPAEEASSVEPLTLTVAGGCGEAEFYALDPSGTAALVIVVNARDRSTTERTEVEFVLPTSDVVVYLRRGGGIDETVCTDVDAGRIDSETPAIEGIVRVRLDPASNPPLFGCGILSGSASTEGLVLADGTALVDVEIASDSIGCYAGA